MTWVWADAAMNLLLVAAACGFWFRAAARGLPTASLPERWLDTMLVLFWLAVGIFYLLAVLGLFRTPFAFGLFLLLGLVAVKLPDGESAIADARLLEAPRLRDPWLWSSAPVLALGAARLVKAMAAPPMTRDAMTMHLPKPAFWLQSGSLALPDFPDAWAYYRWFPAAGEILFAWVMAAFQSDLLLGPFGVLVWILIWAAAARLARLLGCDSQIAWLTGGALASLPAIAVFTTANYVDNLVILFVIFTVTQALLLARSPSTWRLFLTLGAAGLAIGAKASALPVLTPLVATVAVLAWRKRQELDRWALPLGAIALVVPCAGYFHTWLHTGSPVYPFRAPVAPWPYHQGLADLFAGKVMMPEGMTGSLPEVLPKLFWSPPYGLAHMNFGLGGVLLAVTAITGLALALRRQNLRLAFWLSLAGAAVATPLVFGASNLALRTLWVGVLGRHLLVAFAPVFVWAAVAPSRLARGALAASLLVGTIHQAQLGWSSAMLKPTLLIAALIFVVVLTGRAVTPLWRTASGNRGRSLLAWGAAILVAVACFSAYWIVRTDARYDIYRQANFKDGAFEAHPGHPAFSMGASLWPLLDTERDLRIAVTVGKDLVGHNQFFYPLMGSRLQNRLVYVPVTQSGNDSSLEPAERYSRAVPKLWLERLEAADVDLVVGLWQATPEREWLAQQGDYEIVALTSLGVPWIGRHRDRPSILPAARQ